MMSGAPASGPDEKFQDRVNRAAEGATARPVVSVLPDWRAPFVVPFGIALAILMGMVAVFAVPSHRFSDDQRKPKHHHGDRSFDRPLRLALVLLRFSLSRRAVQFLSVSGRRGDDLDDAQYGAQSAQRVRLGILARMDADSNHTD